jgi:putative ABC transport system permease protein
LRKGSQNEIQSGVQPEQVRLLSSAPEVAVGPDGQALVSPETLVLIFAMKEGALSDTEGTNLQVRGVSPRGTELHRVKIEGRLFQPGTSEVVIGKALAGRFQGMRPGGQVHFARRDWNVVGVIDSAGSGFDSEVWGDEDQFLDAFQRRGGFSAVTMRLKDPGLFSALEARMASDPGLSQLEVRRESEYYESQSEQFAAFVKFLGVFVAVIFAFGAALGAMITMYSQVAARTREIGTLRALGFRRRAVMVSFLIESVILGLLAGVVGLALASLVQLKTFSTMNFQSFSEVTFRFTLTGPIAAWSMLFAAVMGYAGGLLPATRAARMPIVEATRGG